MSKKKTTKTEAENPETQQPQEQAYQPPYVKELLEKGVVVLMGRSRGELYEMLAAIPADIPYYAGPIGYHIEQGRYRIQVNKKED